VDIRNRSIVVTGAGGGIGAAMARRFAAEGARGVTVSDIDGDAALQVAGSIGGLAVEADVSVEQSIQAIVAAAEEAFGEIDIFCSNAGIASAGGFELDDAVWEKTWEVNVMAHVYAARAVVPGMLKRGEGYLVNTASAAGLLTNIGAAPYSVTVTKHGAVAFAEWLSVTYGNAGLRVSALCPQFVNTAMLDVMVSDPATAAWVSQATIEPEDVADAVVEGIAAERFLIDAVVEGIAAERFLILPHREVQEFFERKATDYERWLAGMRKLQAQLDGSASDLV
jgi:NAD(P)-dependent dehydrogenase (short-subunit alcohol dehydrogenase family)